MTIFVMIFCISNSAACAPGVAEFEDLVACERAGRKLQEMWPFSRPTAYICVPKTSKGGL